MKKHGVNFEEHDEEREEDTEERRTRSMTKKLQERG